MRVDAFDIRLRRRTKMEAADLGVRLCQHAARSVFPCYLVVAAPVLLLALASFELATWAPTLVLWWTKPWLDRTVLFVLSRAAFGQTTTVRDLWNSQRTVWWSRLLSTLTVRRLSPWRSFTQPVYQLEGLSGRKLRKRILQLRKQGYETTGVLITSAFSLVELALSFALLSLVMWLMPGETQIDWVELFMDDNPDVMMSLASAVAYALVVAFLEPFYVAAGFALYLNRRVELEAWDVEQELRRAFVR